MIQMSPLPYLLLLLLNCFQLHHAVRFSDVQIQSVHPKLPPLLAVATAHVLCWHRQLVTKSLQIAARTYAPIPAHRPSLGLYTPFSLHRYYLLVCYTILSNVYFVVMQVMCLLQLQQHLPQLPALPLLQAATHQWTSSKPVGNTQPYWVC